MDGANVKYSLFTNTPNVFDRNSLVPPNGITDVTPW